MKHTFTHFMAMLLLLTAGRLAAQQTNSPQTNSPSGLKFDSFQLINQRNIFDPTRRPRLIRDDNAPRHTYDYFTLSGTMSYEDKKFAFFEGSGSQYRNHAYAPSESINGYKIAEIANNYVKLMAASNQPVNLSVGMQMRRTDNGPWSLVARPDPTAMPPGETNADGSSEPGADAIPMVGGADSDVIRRLMQRREQEMNPNSTNSNTSTNSNNENHQ